MNVSGDGKNNEDAQAALNQLRMEAEEKKKGMEALEKKKTEAEERLVESEEKNKQVQELMAALDAKKAEIAEKERELQETKTELDELNKVLEEKSQEADESMDKYCSLMIKVHKLEETNDALKTRLEQITAGQRANEAKSTDNRRCSARKSSSKYQEVKTDDNTENMAPLIPPRSPQGSSAGKRGHRDISDKDTAQEALHNLTKKIKANTGATPKPRAEQEEEFRPEGLPELVQKGECFEKVCF